MNPRIPVALVAAALAAAIAQDQGSQGASQVTFQSASFGDFRQLFSEEAPNASLTVPATLRFPEETKERYSAVVIVHTLGGYLEANEGSYAAELREAGFATLTYDTFAARGTTGIALSRAGSGLWPSGVADAYAALRMLASHPKIDPGRIAIVGFSYGGEVAHLAAFAQLRSALKAEQLRFAAHVAFYPGGTFGAFAGLQAYTGSPILMLLGEKDDNLPIAKVETYLAYAKAAGYSVPLETMVYSGAYHAWTVPTLTSLRFYPEYNSAKKCPLILLGAGRPALLIDGQPKALDPYEFARCMSEAPGYSMAYDAAVRTKSFADALAFLQQHLSR